MKDYSAEDCDKVVAKMREYFEAERVNKKLMNFTSRLFILKKK
jgi:hypothetical protein